MMPRRSFLAGILFLASRPMAADQDYRRQITTITYRITWGPLYPEFRTSPYVSQDDWGYFVKEHPNYSHATHIRWDQVVKVR
jgi:hypothetical protein